MLLGGDLGGTKTLLAMAELVDGRPRIIREQRFASRSYGDFADLLGEFLGGQPVTAAAFGLAGPTDGRQAELTYLPWSLDAAVLEHRFAIGRVVLANDFAAAAHGLDLLAADQLLPLQAGQPAAGAPRLVIGAGTGLGVAGLLTINGRTTVVPGEGGHMGFAPQTAEQAALWQYLFAKSGRVTAEDVISGPGLARIHAFLHGRDETPEAIGQGALADDDAARRTMNLWLAAYGAFAGDLALHWLARGGVFVAGGIAAKLLPKIAPQPFVDAFNAKREHRHLVETMPIDLVSEERLGLLGALALASAAGNRSDN